jgi:hypothetical protein
MRLRAAFKGYNALANGVLKTLSEEMPEIDVSAIGVPPPARPVAPGAPVTPRGPSEAKIESPSAQGAAAPWSGEGSRPREG